jgi:hypothetical protein
MTCKSTLHKTAFMLCLSAVIIGLAVYLTLGAGFRQPRYVPGVTPISSLDPVTNAGIADFLGAAARNTRTRRTSAEPEGSK